MTSSMRSNAGPLNCVQIYWSGKHRTLEALFEWNGFGLHDLQAIVHLEGERWEIAIIEARVDEFCRKHENLHPSLASPADLSLQ
ncbi:hypothetical protein ACJ73_10216 [Blastomyces percursus]|uniref:Uncharacterized protein n=1 Tax=Blastomyces percursus TaxID=1658174 RepID=A0A1J9NZM9_9EURO|nr:hypothetical protein ACJ73_10216 [Blastomyces percursus]